MKVSESLEEKVIRFPGEADDWPKQKAASRFEPVNDDPEPPPLPPAAVGAQWPRLFPGL